jgi:hypothetical protein
VSEYDAALIREQLLQSKFDSSHRSEYFNTTLVHMIYTKLSILFFNSLILGEFFIDSCSQGSEKMASNQPILAKETYGLLGNYIQLELKKDPICILQAPEKIYNRDVCYRNSEGQKVRSIS